MTLSNYLPICYGKNLEMVLLHSGDLLESVAEVEGVVILRCFGGRRSGVLETGPER